MITQQKNLRTGTPYWLSLPVPRVAHAPLKGDRKTDVVVIGAGITGAMIAEELTAAGHAVLILDRRGPLKGATTATTALLQYEIDQPLSILQRQIGAENAMRAWRRSKLALDSLEAKIQSLRIRCAARSTHSLYLAGDVLDAEGLHGEWKLRNRIGLHTDYLTRNDLRTQYGIRRNAALRGYGNLTAHPMRLAAGFMEAAIAGGAHVLAPVTVERVEPTARGAIVHTKTGMSITAKAVVYATGYELPNAIADRKKIQIYSTYAVATKPQPDKLWPGRGMIWEASDPYLYVRTTPDGRVICGGEDEEFADEDRRDALLAQKTAMLEKKLKVLFPQLDSRADYAWCGCFGATSTGLPRIGPIPGMKHCYAILSYGGNGITFARLAAEMVLSQIEERDDPDADLYAF